jgi:hypothetical protein
MDTPNAVDHLLDYFADVVVYSYLADNNVTHAGYRQHPAS